MEAVKMETERKQRAGRLGQLTTQQQEAILLLVDGYAVADVAETIGVSEPTIYKWKKMKVFAREYVRASQRVTETGMNLLKTNLTDAVNRLIEISEASSPNRVQLEANKYIIRLVMEDEVLKQINDRLEKLEAGANREP